MSDCWMTFRTGNLKQVFAKGQVVEVALNSDRGMSHEIKDAEILDVRDDEIKGIEHNASNDD